MYALADFLTACEQKSAQLSPQTLWDPEYPLALKPCKYLEGNTRYAGMLHGYLLVYRIFGNFQSF